MGLVAAAIAVSSTEHMADQQGIRSHFSILRTPSESFSPAVAARIKRSLVSYEDHALMSDIQLAWAAGSMWIFSTQRLLCLAQRRAVVCAPKGRASREGVFLGTFRPPTNRKHVLHKFLVQGLVPDGVERILAVIGSRRKVVVDVKANVFSVRSEKPIHIERLLPH